MPPSRIPLLLQPYTRTPPEDSLTLLTSVLNASTNWLLFRYLCAAADSGPTNRDLGYGDSLETSADDGETKVVLVSFLRDWEFWKTECRRGTGLDLAKLGSDGKLAFVDGLSRLFLPGDTPKSTSNPQLSSAPQRTIPAVALRTARAIPNRAGNVPQEAEPVPANSSPLSSTREYIFTLHSPELSHFESTIQSALGHLFARTDTSNSAKTLLIIDDPSILVSATSASAPNLLSSILHIRSFVHSTIISLPADSPLIHLPPTPTPLEIDHAKLVISLAHTARYVVGLRLLDTGVARDVSGVLTVTKGGGWEDEEKRRGDGSEKELLYYIGGDGSVKVFERGAGTD